MYETILIKYIYIFRVSGCKKIDPKKERNFFVQDENVTYQKSTTNEWWQANQHSVKYVFQRDAHIPFIISLLVMLYPPTI